MATWPANKETDWNTKMLAYLAIGHETNGTHGTKSGFQDRGDPAAVDFAVGDFTTDATWRDLDLSSIVPAGAKSVLVYLSLKDDAVDSAVSLRKNGNSNNINVGTVWVQVVNISVFADLIIPCDTNRVIEYHGSAVTFTTINLTVKGWWL